MASRMAGSTLLLIVVGILANWTGCKKEEPTPPDPSLATDTPPSRQIDPAETILRLHGSNTIGAKLAPALAEAFLKSEGASEVIQERSSPVEVTVVGTFRDGRKAIEIAAHGSGTAFTGLGEGKADIGMSSRRIKQEERETLRDLGDLTSPAGEHPIALDGLAVFVHRSNPVEALTTDQIRDIFTCRVTDWSEVGGPGGRIHLYARDDKSGTFDTFKELVLKGERICDQAKRFEDSEQLSQEVAGDESGIGFAGLPFVGANQALKVSEGEADPLKPTPFTVRTEDYLLSRRLFLYTPTAPKNRWVFKLTEFAQSDEGQRIVEQVKFIGQSLAAEKLPEPEPEEPGSPEEPEITDEITRGAKRLPVNLRFATGSNKLDTKADRDIGRIVGWMDDPRYRKGEILLLGFADSRGSSESNRILSEKRAKGIQQELSSEGLQRFSVRGFGEESPVASNDTEEGRAKNRRVEVWWRP